MKSIDSSWMEQRHWRRWRWGRNKSPRFLELFTTLGLMCLWRLLGTMFMDGATSQPLVVPAPSCACPGSLSGYTRLPHKVFLCPACIPTPLLLPLLTCSPASHFIDPLSDKIPAMIIPSSSSSISSRWVSQRRVLLLLLLLMGYWFLKEWTWELSCLQSVYSIEQAADKVIPVSLSLSLSR